MAYRLLPIDEEVEVVGGEAFDDEPVQAIPDETTEQPSESAPSVAEAPPPKAEPVHEAPAIEIPEAPEIPEVTFAEDKPKPLKLKPVDEEVEIVEAAPRPKPKEKDSWIDPKDYALVRGAFEGLKTIQGGAQIATVFDLSMGEYSEEERLNRILAQDPAEGPSEWDRREPAFTSIESAGEAWTYALESLGSAGTSTLPSVVGGAVGAALGSSAGPVGTAVGAYAGAAGPSLILGIGGMYDSLRANEGVRKALENKTLTPDQLLKLTYIGGTMMGALDAFPASKFGKGLGMQAAKDYVRDTIVKAALRGAFEEGATEGLQQVIDEVTQSAGGGDTSLKQQAINVLDSMLQGAIGGAVFGAGTRPKATEEEVEDTGIVDNADETESKTDDQSERANETQPEGTPATVEEGDAAGTPTPGGTGVVEPAQPAGTEKQPLPAEEPAVPAEAQPEPKAQPAPKAQPGVTVVTPAKPDPAIAAALGADEDEDVGDIEEELVREEAGTSEAIAAHEERIRGLFRQADEREAEVVRARERKGNATTVAPAGEAEAAALAALPSARQTVQPTIQPTVQAPVANAPTIPDAAPTPAPAPVVTENLGTGQALAAPEPDIVPEPAATPVATAEEAPDQGAVIRPAPLPEQAPSLVPPEPAPELEVAPNLEPAPVKLIPVTEEVEVVEPAVAAFKPAAPAPQQRTPGKLTLKSTPKAAPVAPKGELYKRRKAPEAPTAQPTPQAAPTAPVGGRAARDAADLARASPELRHSTVSELPHGVYSTAVDEVAAEVVARRRKEEPGKPTLEIVRESVKEIAEKVHQRLAKEHADYDAQLERAGRKAEVGYKAVEKEEKVEAKAEHMATTKVGQQKERAKETGKSSRGIRAESEKATASAYEKEKAKPEAEQDKALMEWGRLHEEQTKLPTTGIIKGEGPHKGKPAKQVREDYKAKKAEQQEIRAKAQEERDAAPKGLNERAKSVETRIKAAIADVPAVQPSGTGREQTRQINAHLARFLDAIKGIPVADHVDRAHQSIWENLAIYAKKLRSKSQDTAGQGPLEFWMAHKYAETDSEEQFYGLATTQKIKGEEYREEGSANTAGATFHEDETSLERRAHEEDRGEYERDASEEGEQDDSIQAKIGKQLPEEETGEKYRPTQIWLPSEKGKKGRYVTIKAETEKGSKVLKDAKKADPLEGFWGILRNAHIRNMTKLVGDVDVHFISGADMYRLAGKENATGLYFNYSNEDRAAGHKPVVFLLRSLRNHPDMFAHNALHEMTHAATSHAIRNDINGTRRIMERMLASFKTQMEGEFGPGYKQALRDRGLHYGLTDIAEFTAEAFSNPHFQNMLRKMTVPADIRRDINALGRGKPPTWWDAFVATVSNALNMVSGTRGQNYMEFMIALDPHMTMSSAEQKTDAAVRELGPQRPPPSFDDFFGSAQPLIRQAADQFEAVKDWAADKTYGRARLRDKLATTGEHIRRSEESFGGAGNALERLARTHLKRDPMRAKLRKVMGWVKPDGKGGWVPAKEGEAGAEKVDNEKIERATIDLKKNKPREYIDAGHWYSDASRWGVDGSVALTHTNNSHISKAGVRNEDARAMHKELAERFAKFSPETQKLLKAHIKHYRQSFDIENDAKVRHSIRQVVKKYHKQLPKGKTIDDAIQWVRSGGARREGDERTAEDKAYHEALGNTAKTLASIPDLHRVKGVYGPQLRKGRLFITVKERPFGTLKNPKNIPKGAVLDALTEKDEDVPNRLLFTDRKDYDAFVASFPGQVSYGSKFVHAKTGKSTDDAGHKISSKDINARKVIVATVQTNRMEMSDSKKHLEARSRELRAQGHRVDAIRTSKKHLHQAVEEISPPQVKALIRNLEQTTAGQNTVSQQLVKGALLDAQVRMMNSPGRLQRHLKRRNVLGNDTDLFDMMTEYNGTMASGLTHFALGHEMAEADQAVEDAINQAAHSREYDDAKINAMQQQASEIRHRIKDTEYSREPKILQVAKEITFLRHLASPHYTIIQLTQPLMMTMPVLSAKYGRGAAWREMMGVLRIGGVRKSLGRGFYETWNASKRLLGKQGPRGSYSHDEFWKDYVEGQPDAEQLRQVIDGVVELGYGASSGIEASDIAEAGKGFFGRKLSQLVDVARALPESAESVNRYTTAFAAYRLAKRHGKSDAEAIREAVLTVEETQGGYGAANNPAFFNNPYLAPATQFRKFSLAYGQVWYRNLAYSFNGATDEQKKVARRTLRKLSVMTIATAGVWGLAPVEIARTLVNVSAMLGFKEDDWEEDENEIQAWVGEFMGEGLSEALFRGAPRLANLDLSGSLGVDNLAMFGQPEEMTSEGIMGWLAKAYFGASGGVAGKSLDAMKEGGEWTDLIPIPKAFKNLVEAREVAFTGTVDKKTGEQYMEPAGVIAFVYKALGFRTAQEAREWEAGGGGYENKEERETNAERRTLMGRWANASPSERMEIFHTEVRDWNREHPDKKMKIDMGDLQRSKRKREKDRKEREKERQ